MKLFNLNVGIKLDNNHEVSSLIRKTSADIVTLQEVMRGLEDSVFDLYNSASIIKEKTEYPYHFFGPLWIANHHEKNGGVISKDFGGYVEQGNYLLTTYPILTTSNIFYYQNYGDFTDTTYFRQVDHPRAFTSSVLKIEEKELLVINVHGIWTSSKLGDCRTIEQINRIVEEVQSKNLPTIIVGDFNLLPNSSSILLMNKYFKNLISEFSISSTRPIFDDGLDQGGIVCDYIFVNDKIKVTDFQVLSTNISDHYPFLLEFEI